MDHTTSQSGRDARTQSLGAEIRTRREQLGLRQQQVADLAGVGVAFLYDLERGKRTVRLDKVLAVLEVLGLGLHLVDSDEVLSCEGLVRDIDPSSAGR